MYMNSPAPMTHRNFKKIFGKLHFASMEVAQESMCAAAHEVRELKGKERILDINRPNDAPEERSDCAVSVDGTWQRRGHAS